MKKELNNMKKLIYIIVGIIVLIIVIIIIGSNGEESEQQLPQEQTQGASQIQQEEKTWHDVISFSGTSNKNTQPFSIQEKQWRIKWNFQDSGEFGDETNGLFVINIYRVGESVITDQVSHSGLSASDTDYIYEGEGEFYFKISVANTKSWSIIVEDLY